MIPMVDLKKQYLEIREEVLEVLNQILESSQYILGSNVRVLEKKIAEYHSIADAVGVASGTDALHLALEAYGIAEGDEVITTPFTFFATAEAVLYTGAKPVFVDIDDDTMNIDPEKIESRITEKTKAIMPVHLFGHPANMEKIIDISKKHNLKIIEDCAQSFGADINGKRTGSFGDAGCFSFYPSKNLGAFGDGGMIVLSNPTIADDIRRLRNHGSMGAYIHESIGFNSRLDEIQAGILLIKLKRINTYNALRKQKAALYNELISDSIQRPLEKPGMTHVYHQYTIRSKKRDKIQMRLRDNNISSVIYYSVPLHLQKAVSNLGYKRGDFPVAEETAEKVLSIPIYPELEEASIKEITKIINNV